MQKSYLPGEIKENKAEKFYSICCRRRETFRSVILAMWYENIGWMYDKMKQKVEKKLL